MCMGEARSYSYCDWVGWPEPANGRIELIDGVPNVREYGDVARTIALTVAGILSATGLGVASGCGIVVDDFNVFHPDICVVEAGLDPPAAKDPTIGVRIAIDIGQDGGRLSRLLDAGVAGVWLVDLAAGTLAYQGEPPSDRLVAELASLGGTPRRFTKGTASPSCAPPVSRGDWRPPPVSRGDWRPPSSSPASAGYRPASF